MKARISSFVLLILALVLPCRAQLKQGDVVAVCGDSITEQKDYSVVIENYLLMCQPQAQIRTAQFGWSGETSWGFLGRMVNDVMWVKPAVATTCYGMNDGGYSPMTPEKAARYKDAQKGIVQSFKKAGVRVIIVGSPGVVDANTFRNSGELASMYNKTLAELRDIAEQVAVEEGVAFANVFDPMMDAMIKAKAKYGQAYHVAGGDGVHPGHNGHLIMAYAYLKAMGCDGNIGTITLDLASGKAEASEGHKVLSSGTSKAEASTGASVTSSQAGTVEIESTKYPFCFFGDAASPDSTRGIVEFFPFNQDLNRFKLVVKGATAEKLKVTWGTASKEFSAAQLAEGINLAAEFMDNPFAEPFRKVDNAVRKQQSYETPLQKQLLHSLPMYRDAVPDEAAALERISAALIKKDNAFFAESAAVTPVRHTIKVEGQ